MERYAYVGVGVGWGGEGAGACASWLADRPEFHRPLGAATGAPRNATAGNTTTFSRAFASGTTVWMNVTTTAPAAGAVAGVAGVAPERAWRHAPGGPDEALTGTITTSCIAWADGTFTGAACYP